MALEQAAVIVRLILNGYTIIQRTDDCGCGKQARVVICKLEDDMYVDDDCGIIDGHMKVVAKGNTIEEALAQYREKLIQ